MALRIAAKVICGDVLVRCGDMIKSLYADLASTDNQEVKTYIKNSIKEWEQYEVDILKQAGQ